MFYNTEDYKKYTGFELGYYKTYPDEYMGRETIDEQKYQIGRFNSKYSQECWLWESWEPRYNDSGYDICLNMTYNEDYCLYVTSKLAISYSTEDISKLSTFSISKETSEFETFCDEIDPESFNQWGSLYATSLFMDCSDIFAQKKQLIPGLCKAAKKSKYWDKNKYLSFLLSMKFMPQETLDAYNECEENRKKCEENLSETHRYWYRDARKEREREQLIDQLEAQEKEYQKCMDTILRNYWYYEE